MADILLTFDCRRLVERATQRLFADIKEEDSRLIDFVMESFGQITNVLVEASFWAMFSTDTTDRSRLDLEMLYDYVADEQVMSWGDGFDDVEYSELDDYEYEIMKKYIDMGNANVAANAAVSMYIGEDAAYPIYQWARALVNDIYHTLVYPITLGHAHDVKYIEPVTDCEHFYNVTLTDIPINVNPPTDYQRYGNLRRSSPKTTSWPIPTR